MPAWTHPIRPDLRPYVASCEGYDWRLPADAVHHGVPSLGLTLIFQFDEPLDCGWLDGTSRERFDVLLAGLHKTPALIRTHGRQHGVQLTLTPLGARALLGCPAAEFAQDMVAADNLLPRHLHAQLYEASWARRFAIIESVVARRIDGVRLQRVAPEVVHAWELIRRSRGGTRIAEVAEAVGWSRRHLAGRMSAEFGLTPKELARVARFEHARRLLLRGLPISTVAEMAGYADQPHLNREFGALGGMTPVESRHDFPIIQDTTHSARAQ